MNHEGPLLETLLRRLSECPVEFIETCKTTEGLVQLVAILSDHFRVLDNRNPLLSDADWLANLDRTSRMQNQPMRYWALLSVATWLLHDDWFITHPELALSSWRWLKSDSLQALSQIVSPESCIGDPDRREELVRLCLASMGLRPKGESIAQAADRMQTLDSVERHGVLRATAEAERRAREVREAMARKQALESASRYGE